MIYFDNNATTPVDERVLAAMLPYFNQQFGNASSKTHVFGKDAAYAVDIARQQIADLIGSIKEEIIFTSGATESINLALKGIYENYKSKGNHIITVKTEHPAVLDTCKYLESIGARIDYLNVDSEGLINIEELKQKISSQTILVCVMMVNNETGVIQPIKEISDIAHQHGANMMSDATQATGKISVNVNEYGIDVMPLSAHKFYGPKGVGCLYIRRKNPRVTIETLLHGGGHERGLRSGTLNVPGIVGMGKAASLIMNNDEERNRIKLMRDKIEQALIETQRAKINGAINHRVNNTSNLSFNINDNLILGLQENIALSNGSACSSESNEPSHVLSSMGLNKFQSQNAVRFSLGRFNTMNEVETAIDLIKKYLNKFEPI